MKDTPVEIDRVLVICNGCYSEREHYPDRSLRSMDEIETFLQSISPCSCGSRTCDVRMHMKEIKG